MVVICRFIGILNKKTFLRFIVITLVFGFVFFTHFKAVQAFFVINDVSGENGSLNLSILYTGEEVGEYSLKIGASYDQSNYRDGFIYNEDSNDFVNYYGSWVDTPIYNLEPNTLFSITGKISISDINDKFFVRLRVKNIEGDSKNYDYGTELCLNNKDYLCEVDLTYTPLPTISVTPTFIITPTPSPTLTLTPTLNVTSQTTPSVTPTPTAEPFVTPTTEQSTEEEYIAEKKTIISADERQNIKITEFYPNPSAGDYEWVELFNENKSDIDLSGWYIDDIVNAGGSPVILNKSIDSKGYLVIEINKSLLNNSNDEVNLFDDLGNIVHKIKYIKTHKNKSIQKLSNGKWYITGDTTKGGKNIDYIESLNIDLKETLTNVENEEYISTINTDLTNFESSQPKLGVLGLNTVKCEVSPTPTYEVLPIIYAEIPFSPVNDVPGERLYIMTEQNIPTPYTMLKNYIKRAFW